MKYINAVSRVFIVTKSLDQVTTKITISQKYDDYIKRIKNWVGKGEENDFFKDRVIQKENELLAVYKKMQMRSFEIHRTDFTLLFLKQKMKNKPC